MSAKVTQGDADGGRTDHDDAVDVIRTEVEAEFHLRDEDEVVHARFNEETGYARATVRFEMCVDVAMIRELRNSDTWRMFGVHPADGGDAVDVTLWEIED